MANDIHANTLQTSQIALKTIDSGPNAISAFLGGILGQAEDTTQWQQYEDFLIASLKTGDEKTARAILTRLTARFGADNERVMGLSEMYEEATASDGHALGAVLHKYTEIVKKNPANVPVQKRRIALLRALKMPDKAIESLVALVKMSPTDVEAWSELSDLYLSLGMYPQSVFALEEVLLTLPNAWNIHARLGELLYMSVSVSGVGKSEASHALSGSIRRYCRSIELCDGYLRGYYGLGLATEKYLELFGDARTPLTNPSAVSADDAQRLHRTALSELRKIVAATGEHYDEAELQAANEFLAQHS